MEHRDGYSDAELQADKKILHEMGYAQELQRRMGAFQNFAISFAIICIVAGGITAFPTALSAGGGAGVGIMWVVGSIFALIVAASMGQIASAYPTAGGIYHWASLLGGRGFGWAAAWFNLLGLIFVVSSVNMGVFLLFRDLFLAEVLGWDTAAAGWVSSAAFDQGWWTQTLFIAGITIAQAIINHFFLRLTTWLTDLSGYLILATAVILTLSLLAFAPSYNFGRLFTFTDFTGPAGGDVWPAPITNWPIYVLGLALLHAVYTITGFDASAHTSEETRNAPVEVPKGMLRSVFYSFLFGYIMVCSFVLAIPDTVQIPDPADATKTIAQDGIAHAASLGWGSFNWLLGQSPMPGFLRALIIVGIVASNFLCALAGLTSMSRMMYAFARDNGLPMSNLLKSVSPSLRTPGPAIWIGGILSVLATLYGGAFLVLSTGCAVFLYFSYLMPIAAGAIAEMNGSWKRKGPFTLGGASILVAAIAVLGCAVLIFVGVQPPQEKVLYLIVVMLLALFSFWQTMEGNRPLGLGLALVTLFAVYYFLAGGFVFSGGDGLLGLSSEGRIWFLIAAAALIVLTLILGGKRFHGPPVGDEIKKRQAEIAAEEAAVGERA
ncbi:MAG: amino acid permease [Hyphomicrobiaceae bacterium]